MAVRFDTEGEHYVGTTGLPTGDTFTVTWWTYISVNRGTWSTLISLDSAGSYTQIATFGANLSLQVYNTDGGIDPAVDLTAGTWYAMAFVQDLVSVGENNGTLYWGTDPASLSSHSSFTGPHTLTEFRIGHYKGAGEWLNGRIAGVKMWDSVLTAPQVAAELQSYDPVITADLLRVHKLQVPELTDYSGNGRVLTGGAGATTEADPPIAEADAGELGRFLLSYKGVRTSPRPVITTQPMQPGAISYHDDLPDVDDYAHPGALVIAGRWAYAHSTFVNAAAGGATVLLYLDTIIDEPFGRYHEKLHMESEFGPAVPRWPGEPQANEWGHLTDFRVGSVLHTKLEDVLELMVSENPHMGGWFADDVGSRSWFPDFDWSSWSTADQQAYRDGAIEVVRTFRRVADRHGLVVMVNGTWNAGTLADDGGGFPNMAAHGCALADGAMIENHDGEDLAFWGNYAGSTQWASQSPRTGTGNHLMFVTGNDVEYRDTWAGLGTVTHHTLQSPPVSDYGNPPTPWTTFHATGMPSQVQ